MSPEAEARKRLVEALKPLNAMLSMIDGDMAKNPSPKKVLWELRKGFNPITVEAREALNEWLHEAGKILRE